MTTTIRATVPAVVLFLLFGTTTLVNAQPTRCGSLPEVLRVGVDEVEVANVVSEARDLYRWACQEHGRRTGEISNADLTVLFDSFDAGAKRNSSTLEEYQDRNCRLSEDTVTSYVASILRQRTINQGAMDAWRACVTGVDLVPQVFLNQTQVNFTMTRTTPLEVTLRGVRSRHFECVAFGDQEVTANGINGEEMALPRDEAVNIDCYRNSVPGEIGGRPVDVYRGDVLTLDLSTGAHNMEFVERRSGPAADEFVQLQEQVETLKGELDTLSGRMQVVLDAFGRDGEFEEFVWNHGEGPRPMIPVNEGICYIRRFAGRFNGNGEIVEILQRDGLWYLDGNSLASGRGARLYIRALCWRFPIPLGQSNR